MTMETHTTPTQNNPDRGPFWSAYEAYNKAFTGYNDITLRWATKIFDAYLHSVSSAYHPNTTPSVPDVVDQASADLQQVIDVAKQDPETNLTDLFRAKTRLAFSEQCVIAPLAYTPGNHVARREISDGAYGLNHHLLERSLEMMDDLVGSPDYSDAVAGTLRGIINEQTTLALLNRTPSDRVATPADTVDDLKNHTDIVYWHYKSKVDQGDGKPRIGQGYRLNIQVKSSASTIRETDLPENGIIVTSHHIGNQHNYETARLITRELAGGEGLTHSETVRLDGINRQFMTRISYKIDENPGVPVVATN